MSTTERTLAAAFRAGQQLRHEMLADGATVAQATAAVAKILKANWPNLKPIAEWPHLERLPRCVKCDGYGYESREVVNRLGCVVTEASVCSCHAGDKYRAMPMAQETALAQVGKVGKRNQSGGFRRWDG